MMTKACTINIMIRKRRVKRVSHAHNLMAEDIIDKILETDIKNSQINRPCKKSYLLTITEISVTCRGCQCIGLSLRS